MIKWHSYLLSLLVLICSCSIQHEDEHKKVLFFGDSVRLIGMPDSTVLSNYLNLDNDYIYLFNNMVSMTLIMEPPAIYHCFILEHVGSEKQIYYLKMDDAIKYNWIPPYDSSSYDLGLDFISTELAGCILVSEWSGVPEYIKPDMPMLWSSKYEHIPSMRKHNEEYYRIISQCDDAKELSAYYNTSLFFKNNDIVSEESKIDLLCQLIKITQIQYVDYFFDLERDYNDIYPIIMGYSYNFDLNTYKVLNFNDFKQYICDFDEDLNGLARLYKYEHLSNDRRRLISKYLLDMSSNNMNYIVNNFNDLEKLFNTSTMMFYQKLAHQDIRIFFFNITYDENNKIAIEKNYYNKEYITTTRIRGYL